MGGVIIRLNMIGRLKENVLDLILIYLTRMDIS